MSGDHAHGPKVGPVFAYSTRREEVERFYREVAGLEPKPGAERGDATWLEAANAEVVVHAPTGGDAPDEVTASPGFVVWFGVPRVRDAYERAREAGAAVGVFHGDYFFARDPDGRYVGFYAEDGHGHQH